VPLSGILDAHRLAGGIDDARPAGIPSPGTRQVSRTILPSVLALLCAALLAGCATRPAVPPPAPYLRDELFSAPARPVGADDLFALSDGMRRYLQQDVAHELHTLGYARGLVETLYRRDKLKLTYDSTMTRNAAQAFEARRGNCLSLVIMTAAFAKELGLQVTYQAVATDETWSRSDDLLFSNKHVNITLLDRPIDAGFRSSQGNQVTIDFLEPAELGGERSEEIAESVVVAMYMNNRSAETLAEHRFDEAYAWARAAILRAPQFLASYNTLAVVYLRHGDLQAADRVLDELVQRDPLDRQALSNLVVVMDKLGRTERSRELRERLARLEPYPPYYFFGLGTEAMRKGDYQAARSLFRREVERADYCSEFHYWLGLANLRLGDVEGARRQIAIALENSTTEHEHDVYAGKLQRLRAAASH
jgi:pentatricopeptide repeat protein